MRQKDELDRLKRSYSSQEAFLLERLKKVQEEAKQLREEVAQHTEETERLKRELTEERA